MIELLVVLAIFSLAVATVTPFVGRFQQSQNAETHAQNIVQTLRRAQNRAILTERDSAWGVRFQTGSYILFAGTAYLSRIIRFDETHPVSYQFSFPGLTEVVFGKGTGTPVTPGSVIIRNSDGTARSITVGAGGFIYLP